MYDMVKVNQIIFNCKLLHDRILKLKYNQDGYNTGKKLREVIEDTGVSVEELFEVVCKCPQAKSKLLELSISKDQSKLDKHREKLRRNKKALDEYLKWVG